MHFLEEIFPPFDEMQSVDVKYLLLAFVDLSFDPVTIQIAEEVVDVFCGSGITSPFSNIKR